MHRAPNGLSPRYPRDRLRPGWPQHKKPSRCRCYLPVLTGFTGGSSRGAPTLNAAIGDTGRTEAALGEGFDPTGADCG